jgi:putative ABC transport system permease protein
MNKMVLANLFHRPLRSLISVIAIAVEVTLILLIVGLCMGMLNDSKDRQKGIGFDIMVSPPGSSFLTGITGAPVSIKVADRLRQVPHVAVATPVVMHMITSGRLEVINGINLDPNSPNDFDKMGRPFHYLKGGPFQGPYDMIVDDLFAEQSKAKIGQTFEVLNHPFRVCGIVEHGKGARKFLPIATLQELIGSEGKASMFYVKVDDDRNIDSVVAAIKQVPGMEQYSVRSIAEYSSLMTVSNMPGLNYFISVVIGVSVVIGFIVIFQAMYTAVMERTREIGILKSLGATKLYIVNVVLRETLLLSLAGFAVGVAASAAARMALQKKFPVMPVAWDNHWVLRAAIIAVAGAVLGAIYPALKAAQKDPIDALAYE